MFRINVATILLVCVIPASAAAQQTRAEVLQQQRAARAGTLRPSEPSALEKGLLFVENRRVFERLSYGLGGFYPRFGGFTTGSGFALGAGYRFARPHAPVAADVSAAFSTGGYKAVDLVVGFPSLWNERVALTGGLHWWDYTRERYYGLGSDSSPGNRSNYGYEALQIRGEARVRPRPWWSLGTEVGYLRPDVQSGSDSRFPSTETVFTDATAPGLDRAPRLVFTRAFVDVDYRDEPGNTRSGGRYLVQWGIGLDQDPSREFSYRRTDVTLEQVFPFFDKKRNFAFRVMAAHVDPLESEGRVAFFLAPTIGGSETLRSYRDARFRDATYLLFNGEYRWEAFSGLDLALFWDAGDVGTKLEQIRVKEFKTGWGIGLRFNTNRSVFMRLDVGLGGPEGSRIFFKFGPAF